MPLADILLAVFRTYCLDRQTLAACRRGNFLPRWCRGGLVHEHRWLTGQGEQLAAAGEVVRRLGAPKGKGLPTSLLHKMRVSSALSFTPCLHQACPTWPGPAALQNQHHPAAWAHCGYVTVKELASTAISLWDTVVRRGYPSTRATLLPQVWHLYPACKGILPGLPLHTPSFPSVGHSHSPCPSPREGLRGNSTHLPAGIWHVLEEDPEALL